MGGSSLKLGSRDLGAVTEEPREDFEQNRDPGVGDSEDEDEGMEHLFKRVSSQRKSQQTPHQPSPAPPKPQRQLPNNSGEVQEVRFQDEEVEDEEEKRRRKKEEKKKAKKEKRAKEKEEEEAVAGTGNIGYF